MGGKLEQLFWKSRRVTFNNVVVKCCFFFLTPATNYPFEGNLKPPVSFMVARKVGETRAARRKPYVTTDDDSKFKEAQVWRSNLCPLRSHCTKDANACSTSEGLGEDFAHRGEEPADGARLFWWGCQVIFKDRGNTVIKLWVFQFQ